MRHYLVDAEVFKSGTRTEAFPAGTLKSDIWNRDVTLPGYSKDFEILYLH